MALFNADSYQVVSIDWLTVTLKEYGITEVGKQCCSPKDHGTRCDRLIAHITNWTYQPDEITEKNTNKGYNRTLKYSNGLELAVSRLVRYMGILVDMSGGYSAKISRKGVDR